MRYREGEAPHPDYPYTENMHQMVTMSVLLAILIGAILFYLGRRGRVLWLTLWSAGLVVCAVSYLLAESLGLI